MYSFTEATFEGKLVLAALFIASIFSWSVMVTKIRVVRLARVQNDRFVHLFRSDRQPLKIYESKVRFDGSPLYSIYRAGCKELAFHLLGSTEVDDTFWVRLEIAERITPSQMRVVTTAMERAVGESALRLESQMILLATAVSGNGARCGPCSRQPTRPVFRCPSNESRAFFRLFSKTDRGRPPPSRE